MTDPSLAALDATASAALVAEGQVSATDLVDAAIARIEATNPEINAVIHPLFDRARQAAAEPLTGPFAGVPMVLKDHDGTLAGAPLHHGNRLLRDRGEIATDTSALFDRFTAAGFVFLGKTNTPEFGLQTTTEPRAYGPTRNPWNTTKGTGGSSGGSAAAVAAGMVPVGHAGDGGGSIRIPSSACGLFGLKPSRGRVSTGPEDGEVWNGLVARHVLTRSVRDSAAILDLVVGEEPGDPYTAPPPDRPFLTEVGADPGRLRIGIRTTAVDSICDVDPECVAAAEDTGSLLESLGHHVEVAGPAALDDGALIGSFLTIVAANAWWDVEDLARIAGRDITEDDVEPGTWALAETGRALGLSAFRDAIGSLHAWSRRMLGWWHDDGFDLLLTPTLAALPPDLGLLNPTEGDPAMGTILQTPYAAFAAAFNVTGQPAMSVPVAMSGSGLPVGVQVVGRAYDEATLYRIAAQLETAAPWADRRPPVFAG